MGCDEDIQIRVLHTNESYTAPLSQSPGHTQPQPRIANWRMNELQHVA
jgi:hypothetical protein